jgi:hypothetical protein
MAGEPKRLDLHNIGIRVVATTADAPPANGLVIDHLRHSPDLPQTIGWIADGEVC